MEEVYKIKRKTSPNTVKLLVISSFVFILLGVAPAVTRAANLYFLPSSGSHTVGRTLTTSVYVSSLDQAMNAVSGVVSFPQDKLEVTSLSKSGSIINLWVLEPSPSNSVGTVNFEGIVLNPGFTGSSGQIITINFKIKAAGLAPLTFSSGSVLANDGQGTNILTSLGNANFSLGGAAPSAPEVTTPAEVAGTPTAPQISSPTHPDPNKWYATSDAKFSWSVPLNVTAARLLVNEVPQVIPTVYYSPAISSKELPDLADGTWYFHVRLRNTVGWGGISHFRFQIDTEKPESFNITEVKRDDPTEPRVQFIFDAADETSGIGYYEVQIDDSSAQIWQDDGSSVYETPALGSGKHLLIVKAVDKAGNSLANLAEFTIEALESPIITEYPKELRSGVFLVVKGSTYPNNQVVLWLQREKEDEQSYIVESDKDGNFIFIADEKTKDGIYQLWAEVIDERGARSEPSKKVTIAVKRLAILRIGSLAVGLLSVLIPLIALIILLLALIWYGWHKLSLLKVRLRKEIREAEQALHKAFDLLKEDIREQIKRLEKVKTRRKLTEAEDRIIKKLKKDLDDAEKNVTKEIEDIEEELK